MSSEEMMGGEENGSSFGCGNCGEECKLKCGTRQFRLCCTHFFRKRSADLGSMGAMRNALEKASVGTAVEKFLPYWFALSGAPLSFRFVPVLSHAGPRLPLASSAENDYIN